MIPAQEALEHREIVLLKGGSNGKTRIAFEMQEALGYQDAAGRYRTKAHPENPTVEFVNIIIPGYYAVHETYFQRAILRAVHGDAPRASLEVQDKFKQLLKDYAQPQLYRGPRIICVVIDNAETMPAKAFGIVKSLNEKRDSVIVKEGEHKGERRWLGCAFLISGHYHKLKAPLSFYRHATEITVGKIERAEIRQVIAHRFPSEAMHFDEASLERLAQLATTNDLYAAVRGSIQKRREERSKTIDTHIVEEALKGLTQPFDLVPSLQTY
jgi:hypothetical protein